VGEEQRGADGLSRRPGEAASAEDANDAGWWEGREEQLDVWRPERVSEVLRGGGHVEVRLMGVCVVEEEIWGRVVRSDLVVRPL
jgi:hypothetical protein